MSVPATSAPPRAERLRLLASAIAARPVEVVTSHDDRPWTDGTTIHLPADAPMQDAVPMVVVQASLIAAGSLAADAVAPLARRRALARRYLTLEGHRALAETGDLLPPGARDLIDPAIAVTTTTPATSLARARSGVPIADPPPVFGVLHPRRVHTLGPTEPDASAGEGDRPRREQTAEGLAALDDDTTDGEGDLGNLLSSPVGGGGPLGKLLARLLASTRSRGGAGDPGADAPTHVGAPRPGAGRRAPSVTIPAGRLDGPVSHRQEGTTYPEWDVRTGRYRAGWCTVQEDDPPVGEACPVPSELTRALRRPLARLGVGRVPTHRQRQGDDIDIDAAVEARVDRVAGTPHDETLYIESQPHRRDLAILILLDVSGSAGEPGVAGRTVHEHQRAVAAALMEAAHRMGDRVALYGFRSRGRKAVQLLRAKAFDDHLDGAVRQRLGGLEPGAYTRLGTAIRHGAAILEARGGTPRRLLVVLSDGFAYDHGYEGRYGEADARRALVEARRRGVGCLCLSVGADAEPAALRRVFGPAAHAMVPLPAQLAGVIGPLFRSALRSAESQQRVHQRRERLEHRSRADRRGDHVRSAAVPAAPSPAPPLSADLPPAIRRSVG